MLPLPSWMRRTLYITAVANIAVAMTFLPAAESMRVMAGFPAGGDPFYLLTIGLFVLLFGIGYLWTAMVGRSDRLFIAIATAGKLSFVALVVHFWSIGAMPLRAPILASADLIFGAIFLVWLLTARAPAPLVQTV